METEGTGVCHIIELDPVQTEKEDQEAAHNEDEHPKRYCAVVKPEQIVKCLIGQPIGIDRLPVAHGSALPALRT